MSYDSNCFYCTKEQKLQDLMIEICKLDSSTLYLFKEQTYRGRCLLAYNQHVKEIFELDKNAREAFLNDIARVAAAINQAFGPGKINYGIYGDTVPHLHCHVVPKYEGGHRWGTTFEMMPEEKTILSEAEYAEIITKIKRFL